MLVGHIAGVNGLAVLAHAADAGNGARGGVRPLELDQLGGHDAAHAAVRVAQELVQKLAGLRGGLAEHPACDAGGQLLQNVHRVVHEQLLHDLAQLAVTGRLHDGAAKLRRQQGEPLRRQLLGQSPERQHRLLHRQRLQKLRQIHFIFFAQKLPQLPELLLLQQLAAQGPNLLLHGF